MRRGGLITEAAYYSVSSIIWRLFNVIMLPLYTSVMPPDGGAYGLMTNLYGWGGIISIILPMGLETAFMRVASKENEANPAHVYSSAFIFICLVVTAFALPCLYFAPYLASLIGYPNHIDEIRLMIFIIAGDTLLVLPYCYLRYIHNAQKYAVCKALYAIINAIICFTVLYLCPRLQHRWPNGILWEFYMPNNELNYVLGANVATCFIMLYILIEEWKPFGHFHSAWGKIYNFSYVLDTKIIRRLISYAIPIMGASLIDVAIQNLDRVLYPWLVPGEEGLSQLGIYGACFRIGMIMALATQVLRDIADPTLFRLSHSHRAVEATGGLIMKYFLICSVALLLGIETCMKLIQDNLLIDHDYWQGLNVVPILMCSEILVGVQYYMSFWYKLTDRPLFGTIFALVSLLVIFFINVIFVPVYGYIACAWAIFCGCVVRVVLTFVIGKMKSKYTFRFKGMGYMLVGLMIYILMRVLPDDGNYNCTFIKLLCTVIYLAFVYQRERRQINRTIKKIKQRKH